MRVLTIAGLWCAAALFLGCATGSDAAAQTARGSRTPPPSNFVLSEAAASTVRVVIVGPRGVEATGSGVAIAPHHVLTNLHVVQEVVTTPGYAAFVIEYSPDRQRRARQVVWFDDRSDLAVLQVEGEPLRPARIALAAPRQLDDVFALGFPVSTDEVFQHYRTDVSATRGHVTAVDFGSFDYGPVRQILHSATVNRGNSGGPLFNACGELVGINTWNLAQGAHIQQNHDGSSPNSGPMLVEGIVENSFVASAPSELGDMLQSSSVAQARFATQLCLTGSSVHGQSDACEAQREGFIQAINRASLTAIELALHEIPANCVALQELGWRWRQTLVTDLVERIEPVRGTWRLPNGACDDKDALFIRMSGVFLDTWRGASPRIEWIADLGGEPLRIDALTVHPQGDFAFRYTLTGDASLRVETLRAPPQGAASGTPPTVAETVEYVRCT